MLCVPLPKYHNPEDPGEGPSSFVPVWRWADGRFRTACDSINYVTGRFGIFCILVLWFCVRIRGCHFWYRRYCDGVAVITSCILLEPAGQFTVQCWKYPVAVRSNVHRICDRERDYFSKRMGMVWP